MAVTGDLRRDLFRYLSGHSLTYYAEKQPGMLASRITATSNAVYTSENTMAWNVLPPCIAVMGAVVMIIVVNSLMALGLFTTSAILAVVLFKLAGRGSARHHTFATKAAAVDGELVDVIGNMALVHAFGMTLREEKRFGQTVKAEMDAREQSLFYLEKLRLLHAVITTMLSLPARWAGHCFFGTRAKPPPETLCWSARSASLSCTARATWRWRWWT